MLYYGIADKNPPLNGGDSWASTKLVMNAQTICFSGRLSVRAWRRQLSEWPRFEWWSTQPLFRSAVALWALTHPAHAALPWNKVGDGFCCRPTELPERPSQRGERRTWGRAWGKLNERTEWMRGRERNEGMDRRCVLRVEENGRYMAGECFVSVNEDLGHCVPANL